MYVGKDSYGILCLKSFEDTAAPLSGENMLEPMKLYKTPKSKCQKEPWDLSVCHSDISADMSGDLIDNEQSDMPASDLKSMDIKITNTSRSSTPVPKPGENVKIGSDDDVAVLVNKWKGVPDELCYTWSEVKLYQLTNSELEKYLRNIDQNDSMDQCSKWDNIGNTNQADVASSAPCRAYLKTGRPLQRAAKKSMYVESDSGESDINDDATKAGNRVNLSKPSSSGPSAE